jgi:alkylation response protein AidB-like acyl-CoA dehydrogenase
MKRIELVVAANKKTAGDIIHEVASGRDAAFSMGANMVHDVVDTAIQLHGALGYSLDTPLAAWYTHIRSQRLVDGPDEVHKWITGKNVIRAFKKDGTTAAAAGGDLL